MLASRCTGIVVSSGAAREACIFVIVLLDVWSWCICTVMYEVAARDVAKHAIVVRFVLHTACCALSVALQWVLICMTPALQGKLRRGPAMVQQWAA